MIRASKSPIVLVAGRMFAPLIQVMAFYVICHGHYSPGGGFQGGVLLTASFVLLRLSFGPGLGVRQVPTDWATLLSAAGTLLFVGTGLVALAAGGHFLDYGHLPGLPLEPAMLRFFGILIIEVAVGVAVAAGLLSIYDDLLTGEESG